jgi:hypothetical protein
LICLFWSFRLFHPLHLFYRFRLCLRLNLLHLFDLCPPRILLDPFHLFDLENFCLLLWLIFSGPALSSRQRLGLLGSKTGQLRLGECGSLGRHLRLPADLPYL